jgi:hypothetical protein
LIKRFSGESRQPWKTLVGDRGPNRSIARFSFLIEDTFVITIAPNEFETEFKKLAGVYEKDFLTAPALAESARGFPGADRFPWFIPRMPSL